LRSVAFRYLVDQEIYLTTAPFDLTLPPHLTELLVERGTTRTLPRNTVITYEGDPAEQFYLVQSGRVRAYVSDEEGRQVTLEELGEGEYFGEMALGGGTRSASFVTLCETRLVFVPRRNLLEVLAERPDLTKHLLMRLAQRVGMFAAQVKSLALTGVEERVINLLKEMGEPEGGNIRVPKKLSQQAIALRVGASRSMINRVIKSMLEAGQLQIFGDAMVLMRNPSAPFLQAA
jgi:CRP/FNR family cyclic AMP-dependent transcriptional regulator